MSKVVMTHWCRNCLHSVNAETVEVLEDGKEICPHCLNADKFEPIATERVSDPITREFDLP